MWSELPPQLQIPHLHRPHGQSHVMHLCHAVLMAFFVPRYGTLPDQLVGSWSAGKHNLCTARRTCTSVSSRNAIGSGSAATFSKRLYPCGHDASGVRKQCAAKRRESVGQQLVSGTFKFAAAVTAIGQTAQFRQIILGKFASCQQLAARRVMRV